MLRSVLWTLRQPRYAALSALMLVVAALCAVAGTWQISRFEQKIRANDALRANAHAAVVPLGTGLVPLVHHGPPPGREAIRYRTVRVSGRYLDRTEFLRNQSQGGASGFYAVSPLRTASGVLLVARGFVAATAQDAPPATVPAPPRGRVSVTGRLQTPDTRTDAASTLPNAEIETVNPADQSARLRLPVYDAYLTPLAHQPGTAGLAALPAPDLSNPAGGAVEPQHFAYIVQWYLFALLALAAPFLISRSEVREARRRYLGVDPDAEDIAADRLPALAGGAPAEGALAVREGAGALARRDGVTPEQRRRAARLADRYGRSLGAQQHDEDVELARAPRPERARRPRSQPVAGLDARPPDSSAAAYRSEDSYQGSYNDYLWELALADGRLPAPPAEAEAAHRQLPRPQRRAVEGEHALDAPPAEAE